MDKKKCAHYKKKIIIKAQDRNNRKTKVSIQILKRKMGHKTIQS